MQIGPIHRGMEQSYMKQLLFIGGGNMGQAIAHCMQRKLGDSYRFFVSDPSEKSLNRFDSKLFTTSKDSAYFVAQADIIFFCVKPQHMNALFHEIRDEIKEDTLCISIAAGLGLSYFVEQLSDKTSKIVRTMPNLLASIGSSVTFLSYSDGIDDKDRQIVRELIGSFGSYYETTEALMPAVPAISGSSPAYFFLMLEAMADGAVRDGFPRAQAYEAAAATMLGSAKLFLEDKEHPGVLKDKICSPAGTTIEAVVALEEHGFRSAILQAMKACTEKSNAMLP